MGLFLKKNHLLSCGCFSFLNWISSIAKTASKIFRTLVLSLKFLSHVVALYLCKSTIPRCREYFCHVWMVAPNCYLDMLDRLQKQICRSLGPELPASIEPLAHRQYIATLSHFYRYLVNVHLNWLNWFHFLILVGGSFLILMGCMIFLSPLPDVIKMSMSTVSFLAQLEFFACRMLSFDL